MPRRTASTGAASGWRCSSESMPVSTPARDVGGDHPGDRAGGRGLADEAEALGGASLHAGIRVGQRGHQRLDGRAVADEAQRERRHRAHFGLAIAGHQPGERGDAGG